MVDCHPDATLNSFGDDIADCHPDETFYTKAKPKWTMLSDGRESTMSFPKECDIFCIIPKPPFLKQILTLFD